MQKKHLCTIFVTLSDTLKSNTVHTHPHPPYCIVLQTITFLKGM